MINYELAKKLKDAGFPMKRVGGLAPDGASVYADAKGAYLLPTLSELIEACGTNFYGLRRDRDALGVYWIAETRDNLKNTGGSETPEEAVARLWLALNAKGV